MKKPVALVILDGVGVAPDSEGNAVTHAKTPNLDKWAKQYPNILMNASGEPVGLPDGQMGNSEVGHMNIGAGRIVYQSLALMNKEVKENLMKDNKYLLKAIDHAKKNNSKVNILGLISDGGVHSHISHIIEIARILKTNNVEFVLHAFTDGRDVSQKSAMNYLKQIIDAQIPISSISGRYYAMDRDQRWDRVQLAYDVIADRKGASFKDADEYVKNEYSEGRFDEFFNPSFNPKLKGVSDGDSIIFINFRPDRAREISHLLIGSDTDVTKYQYDPKQGRKENLYFVSSREYAGITQDIMYPPIRMKNLIGEVLENNKLKQVRAAETEKYPHVTFFIDGGQEIPKKHETRILVDSPKVATYDLEPEMSCRPLTEKIIQNADGQDVFLINFAQPDMVGHTGVLKAVIKSLEVADEMLGKLYTKIVKEMKGVMLITADHGNADRMINKDGSICTTHTTAPVRLIITDKKAKFKEEFTDSKNIEAKLGDLAPTILKYAGIKKPKEMTGNILIK
ncbi:MAG: 2,3-bisphosphoglycerate-independent phosphoglycerate mutase [Candidatus Tyloplasma litorale]|nr:MAG: 2,3-bisphosphoglycerate-independent phosphoglycerate mutase [Mycoplasmatales bacterium]